MLDEFVEEGVFAVVGGPDGHVTIPGDAGLGGLPKEPGVGMFGELIDADIAAMDGHGVGIGRKSDDARAVIKTDVANLDLLGERGGLAIGVEARDVEVIFAAGEDAAGKIKELDETKSLVHVLEGTGPVFGDEEIITIFVMETFADIFEAVAIGPANADGFFSEGKGGPVLSVDEIVGLDPDGLVRGEVFGQEG